MSPEQVASDPSYGGHRFFTFRRVEDLRAVMVKNGDASKQIWLLEFGWTSDQYTRPTVARGERGAEGRLYSGRLSLGAGSLESLDRGDDPMEPACSRLGPGQGGVLVVGG